MAKWREKEPGRDHPEATAWVCYGNGQGNFTRQEVIVGHGWHEARLADLDADGDLDLLSKPYTWDTPRVDIWLIMALRASTQGAGSSKSFRGPVGLQLYSLRDLFAKNVPLGLQMTRSFGFQEVELAGTYGLKPDQLSYLQGAGLKAIASLVDYKRLETSMDQALAEAKALGIQYLRTAASRMPPSLPKPRRAKRPRISIGSAKRCPNRASSFTTTTMVSSSCRMARAPSSIC